MLCLTINQPIGNRIWRLPFDYHDEEVALLLLGKTDNDGPNVLPAGIIIYRQDDVELASQQ
jgi:hypothetical protein